MTPSVAGLIIGNEVLTAKVVEANGAHLTKRLRERGLPLRMLMTVPDEVDAIVEAIDVCRRRAQWLITSGGVGPTHDDVTVRAVALALGRKVVRLPRMEALVKEHYGESATAEAMRLAEAPQGAELWDIPGHWYPVLTCERVFMLPGVPMLFKAQLEIVLQRLPTAKVELTNLYLNAGESEIASALDMVALAMPDVAIGSYPTFDPADGYRVKITVEHAERAKVSSAVERLEATLPAGSILRRE
jgi:molybdenum cofactor synthesis domain-containing protein